ncbi:MAG: response regulator [Actinobacteria bacterium]|nr:response regulator [Actinomycetota bacterium]MBU1944978.1 response regulator [Actinomycetota bacterium]MBU2688459.1 response regulator [Actinomycetota bacterium]
MKKVLLVDDDKDFVESTRAVLEEKYAVIVAYDGDKGIEMARAEKPDLIILDVIMPTEDGFSAAEEMKNDAELTDIPIMMLTSFASRGVETNIPRSRGMELQSEDYIDKPVEPDVLLAHAEKLLA